MRYRAALLGVVGLLVAQPSWATTYAIDRDHSTVGFKIRHLFSNVTGSFDEYQGTVNYVAGHPEQWSAEATIQAASINTKTPPRDKHLRSADFFDVEKYPTLTFKSTGVKNATNTTAQLTGDLTIHGVTKPVALDIEIHGAGKDPWGNVRAGFSGRTTINRTDFGLHWNQAVETGGVLVGEDVEILLEVEGIVK